MISKKKEEVGNFESNGCKLTIVIVDDNPNADKIFGSALAKEFECIFFSSCVAALDYTSEEVPDLIISNLTMPDMDGLAFAREIRENIMTSHVPVIMMVHEKDESCARYGLEEYIDDYLIKPMSEGELLLLVHSRLALMKRLRNYLGQATDRVCNRFPPLGLSLKDQEFLTALNKIIESSGNHDSINANHLSDEIGISESHLSRKSECLFGCSLMEYFSRRRAVISKRQI